MLFKLKNCFGTKADLSELDMNKSRLKIGLILLTIGALRFWICSQRVLGWKYSAVFKLGIIKCGIYDSRAWCLLSAKSFYVLFFSIFKNLIHMSYIQDTKNHLQFHTEKIFLLEMFFSVLVLIITDYFRMEVVIKVQIAKIFRYRKGSFLYIFLKFF